MNKKVKSYILLIVLPLLVGGLSAILTSGSMGLYETIVRPPLSPPPAVFPIVWTILYTLMGVSSGLVYNSNAPSAEKNNALAVYFLQLIINFFWSIVFFNQRAFFGAFILILILLSLVGIMIIKFYKIDKTAAFLQIPYFLWIIFAAYLTLMIYLLNR